MIKCDSYTIRCGVYGFRVIPKPLQIFSVVFLEGTYYTWWKHQGILKTFLPKETQIFDIDEVRKNDVFNQNPREVFDSVEISFKTTEAVYAKFIQQLLDWKNSFSFAQEQFALETAAIQHEMFNLSLSNTGFHWFTDKYGVPIKVRDDDIAKLPSPENGKYRRPGEFFFRDVNQEIKNFNFMEFERALKTPIPKPVRNTNIKVKPRKWWQLFKVF